MANKLEDLFNDKPADVEKNGSPVEDPFAGITAPPSEEESSADFFSSEDEAFSEDFTGQTSTSRLVPEGLNKAKCTNIEKSKSRAGDPMYVWTFVVTEGEGRGATLKLFTSLASQARWKVIETLEGLGIPASDRVVRFQKSDVVGKEVWVVVAHEVYKGRKQNSVNQVLTEEGAVSYAQDNG